MSVLSLELVTVHLCRLAQEGQLWSAQFMSEHRGCGMTVISIAQDKSNYSSQAHTTAMQGYIVYYVNIQFSGDDWFFIIKIVILWNNNAENNPIL